MKVSILTVSLLGFLFTFSTQTFAVDFIVNLTTDQHDASTADGICDIDTVTAGLQCTLRAAVEQANALASNDRVLFNLPANSTITLTTANGGEILITNNGTLEIVGTGANNLTIDGGAGTNRIFYTNQATVTISGVTIMGGGGTGANNSGFGGAIFANFGTLVFNSVHVTANSAVSNSGGGLFFLGGTNHQILNSTFSANTAASCAGFNNQSGTLVITNSTISGNMTAAGGSGGGFCSNNNTTLRSVTVTDNSSNNSFGGGILFFGNGTLNLGNTIVAGNTGGSSPDIRIDPGTVVTTAGYNLIGNNDSVSATFPAGNPNANNDIVGTSTAPVNPMLAALADNNSINKTPTHELMTGSPAIDKGFSFGSTTDQRGLTRPADNLTITNATNGDGADIGAFEVQLAPTAASVLVGGRITTAKGRGILKVRVTVVGSNGETRTTLSNPFGYYHFADVPAGETYVFSVSHKRYTFNQSAQVLTIVEETNEVNFVADN